MTEEKRYTFVDADSILYTCAYGDKTTNAMIRKRYDQKLLYIQSQTFCDELVVTVKGRDNFRDAIYPEYKANRPPQTDAMRAKLNYAHSYALERDAVQADGWEADDQVRAWAYEATQEGNPWVIAAIDKDLLQIPGTHFNYTGSKDKPYPEDKKWNFIEEKEGTFRLACQMLTGDVTDNIIAIKGIGPAKSAKALKDKNKQEMMTHIISEYKREFDGNWEKQLILNTNLLYMRKTLEDEFDYKVWLNG